MYLNLSLERSAAAVEIPKSNGKTRLLGVPTVVDRLLQQAVSQQLATRFELDFEAESYGFRPRKNLHGALRQSLKNINDGYQDIVDIDLKGFFDETVRRCGTALQAATADLQQGKMLHDSVADPQVVASAYPDKGEVATPQKGNATGKPLESFAVQYTIG